MGNKSRIENNFSLLDYCIIHKENKREPGLRSGELSFGCAELKVPVKHPSVYVEQTTGRIYGSKMNNRGLVINTNFWVASMWALQKVKLVNMTIQERWRVRRVPNKEPWGHWYLRSRKKRKCGRMQTGMRAVQRSLSQEGRFWKSEGNSEGTEWLTIIGHLLCGRHFPSFFICRNPFNLLKESHKVVFSAKLFYRWRDPEELEFTQDQHTVSSWARICTRAVWF